MRQSLRDHVGIIDDVTAEEKAATSREDKIRRATEGDEHSDDAGHH